MMVSALCTYGATLWMKQQEISVWCDVLLKWLSENGSFYASVMLCSGFIPKAQRTVEEGSESLLQLVIVECVDTTLRCGLFYASSLFPEWEEEITAWGSLGLDLVFLALVEKSHCLVEISRTIVRSLRPARPLSLGLA